MRKSSRSIVIITLSLFTLGLCGCGDMLRDDLAALQAQIDALAVRVDQLNESISSLSEIVKEIQSGGYVKDYVEIVENGKAIGWKLTFSNGKDLMLYNGKDGATPQIGIRKDTDGEWYWTLNDEWLLRDGQKIRVNGKDGVMPQLKIENDWWWVSYDNGKTWTKLSKAKGENGKDGDSFFSSVVRDGNSLVLTLGDGSSLVIPCYQSIQMDIIFDDNDFAILPGGSATVGYTIVGATEKTVVKALGQNGWSAKVTPNGVDKGSITVQAPDPLTEDEIIVLVYDGEYRTIMRSLNFVAGGQNNYVVVNITLPPDDEIWYESQSGNTIPLAEASSLLVSNTYSSGKGVYKFSESLTSIGGMFDYSEQCGTTKENEDFKSLILPKNITHVGQFGISHLCKATKLVLPYNLSSMGSDCLCGFGEWTQETSNIYFIGDVAPSFVSTSIWNMNDKVLNGNKIDNFYYPGNNASYNALLGITIQGSATHNWVPAKYSITFAN